MFLPTPELVRRDLDVVRPGLSLLDTVIGYRLRWRGGYGRDQLPCQSRGTHRSHTQRRDPLLADADGVELTSSDQAVTRNESMVALDVTVQGAFEAVADAVASIRDSLPPGASIEITGR